MNRNPFLCTKVIESQHPYLPNQDVFWTVQFPGAAHIVVYAGDGRERVHAIYKAKVEVVVREKNVCHDIYAVGYDGVISTTGLEWNKSSIGM